MSHTDEQPQASPPDDKPPYDLLSVYRTIIDMLHVIDKQQATDDDSMPEKDDTHAR